MAAITVSFSEEVHRVTLLENVVLEAINRLLGDKSNYQAQLQQNITKVICGTQQNTADGIDEKLIELQKELLKKANNKEAYDEYRKTAPTYPYPVVKPT